MSSLNENQNKSIEYNKDNELKYSNLVNKSKFTRKFIQGETVVNENDNDNKEEQPKLQLFTE